MSFRPWILWLLLLLTYGCAPYSGLSADKTVVPIKLYEGPDLPDNQVAMIKLEGLWVNCGETTFRVDGKLVELDVHAAVYGNCDPINLSPGSYNIAYSVHFGKRGRRYGQATVNMNAGRVYHIKGSMAIWWPGAAVWIEDDTGTLIDGTRKLTFH